jgi:hypothetical protein
MIQQRILRSVESIIHKNMIIYCTGEGTQQVAKSITELKDEKGDAFKVILNCLNVLRCLIGLILILIIITIIIVITFPYDNIYFLMCHTPATLSFVLFV